VPAVVDPEAFDGLLARLRAGDEAAARELVTRYEPLVRREVRLNLRDRRLGRMFDSMDVAQSVFATFFVRAAAGEFDLAGPPDLVRLLVTVARNKLASAARKAYAEKRDVRRHAAPDSGVLDRVSEEVPTPSHHVAAADLLQQVIGRLGADDRVLVALRAEGLSWDEVAARVGGTAQARRVQLSRALAKASQGLGLDAGAD
jgi:RNA polymerase sigma-70 factor (ECF subfamily)